VIVLDEQLKKVGVQEAIGRWYRGRVCTINDLWPGSVIKDDIVPVLLRTVGQPPFITVNWPDFWPHTPAHQGFCVICFTVLPDSAVEVSPVLRRLLRLPAFKTKAARMGKIARVSSEQVTYYQARAPRMYTLSLP